MSRFIVYPILCIAAMAITACSPVDDYSSRSISYNIEAEQLGNQALLLNVVRAYLHRPLQFTDISSIVGSTSGSGGLSIGFPIGPHPATSIATGTASGSLTGSTTFTVPVFNTQEFYQGILNPIQSQLVDFLLKTPNQKELMFDLIFDRITVKVSACGVAAHDALCERDFRNDPSDDLDLVLFQTMADYLLNLQITSEQLSDKKAAAAKPAQTVVNVNGTSTSGDDKPAAHKYRLCFDDRAESRKSLVFPPSSCAYPPKPGDDSSDVATRQAGQVFFASDLATEMGKMVATEDERGQHGYGKSLKRFSGELVSITLRTRSTYEIFRYLGALAERARVKGQYSGGPFEIGNARRLDYNTVPCAVEEAEGCKPLFVLETPTVSPTALAYIAYAGSSYGVPGDPSASFSPDVLAVLKELVALNVSAKSLPTSAVLSLTPTQ